MKEKIIYSNDVEEEIGDEKAQIEAYKDMLDCNGLKPEEDPEELADKAHEYAYELVDEYPQDLLDNSEYSHSKDLMVVVLGNMARWDGNSQVGGTAENVHDAIKMAIPDGYEAFFKFFVDEEGNFAYSEATHDCPTGGTKYVYRLVTKKGYRWYKNNRGKVENETLIKHLWGVKGYTKRLVPDF